MASLQHAETGLPSVSIVIPLYNSAPFMHTSIDSVLKQTHGDFELILVDDGSTDDTLVKARALEAADSRVKVVALAVNGGAANARNKGIEAASRRYIAFLDSDDDWDSRKLEIQLSCMTSRGAALSYTDYQVRRESGGPDYVFVAPEVTTYASMAKRPSINCSTAIYDTAVLGKRYFPIVRKSEDFALWLSILREIGSAHKCGGVLAYYNLRSGSVSSNKLETAKYTWKVLSEIEKLSFPVAGYYFVCYAFNNIKKRLLAR